MVGFNVTMESGGVSVEVSPAMARTDAGVADALDGQSISPQRVAYTGYNANRLKMGVLGDIHWRSSTTTSEDDIPSKPETKDNLDVFIDDMNNNVQPDVVVQMGDVPFHGAADANELATQINEARDWLENSGGSSGTGLDCPIYYIIGNHEYTYAGTESMDPVYNAFGWNGLSDTWQTVDVNGIRLLLLNTSYTTTDKDTDTDDHIIPDSSDPANELQFISDEVARAEQDSVPLIPFVHVPVSSGSATDYDSAVNEDVAARYLSGSSSVTGGFFGHCHHGPDGFDRVVQQQDDFGGRWLHCPTPHHFEHQDFTVKPYQRVQIAQDGRIASNASYDKPAHPSEWHLDGNERPAYEVWQDDNLRFEYPGFDSIDGWETAGSTTTLLPTNGSLKLETGASSGTQAYARKHYTRKIHDNGWGRAWAFKFSIRPVQTTSVNYYAGAGRLDPSSQTDKHVGIQIQNPDMYLSVGDGSTNTLSTDPIKTVNGNSRQRFKLLFVPGEEVRIEEINRPNVRASISSGLPTGGLDRSETLSFGVETSDSNAKQLQIHHADLYIGKESRELRGSPL